MRWLLLMGMFGVSNACWIGTKEGSLKKILSYVHDGRDSFDKPFIDNLCKTLPAPIAWAANKIGTEAAFRDCDANGDGVITIKEMRETDTCLTDCTKLAILNMVL